MDEKVVPVKAFILAGGLGTRLRPLTYEIAKLMIPIHGKPILEHWIELFRKHNVQEIILSIGYKASQFMRYFGDGSKFGVRLRYIIEEKPLGTAGSLRLAKNLLRERFYMCNGDNLFSDMDLATLYNFHTSKGMLATIALKEVEDITGYGVVNLEEYKIKRFVEKPLAHEAPSKLINSGLYVLEPSVIDLIPEGRAVSIEREIWPVLASREQLAGFLFQGQWFPTDTWERYEKAFREWKGSGTHVGQLQ